MGTAIRFRVDGVDIEIEEGRVGLSLLEVLRDHLGKRSVKDGCAPQGQCGCCTVWVDGAPRVSCVTPLRRVAGREVTTFDGLGEAVRDRWVAAFVDAGASQCGFCTPGIIMRLAARDVAGDAHGGHAGGAVPARDMPGVDGGHAAAIKSALAAHLCRCTGWQTIVEAALAASGTASAPETASAPGGSSRDLLAATIRAGIEGGSPQVVSREAASGYGGFAEDTAPGGALVAVPDGSGSWVVAPTLWEARAEAGKVQGRRSTLPLRHPLEVPPGCWDLTLQTTFVEPAYLEPDASWCLPGGEPADPLANGGAFGAKRSSPVAEAARRLADRHGQAVRVVFAREDVVRMGPKRPPIAAGIRRDSTGVVRVARTPGSPGLEAWISALASVAPGLEVEEVECLGPPVSPDLRGAGWVEGAVLLAGLRAACGAPGEPGTGSAEVAAPSGARASARIAPDGQVAVRVCAGEMLDEVTLRSYCLGAAHQALGWVRTEGLAVDRDGHVQDLTIRSFGVLPARVMPRVEVEIADTDGVASNGSDAVFAAVAAAAWIAEGLPTAWPMER